MNNAYVLICHHKIENIGEIVDVLDKVKLVNSSLLIIASDISN